MMFLNFEWPAMGIVFDSLKPEPRSLADARQAVTMRRRTKKRSGTSTIWGY
jgi:hypothetical protein